MPSSPYREFWRTDLRDRSVYRISTDFMELDPYNSLDWSEEVLLMMNYDFGSIIFLLDGRIEFAGDESRLKREFFESAKDRKVPYSALLLQYWKGLIASLLYTRDKYRQSLAQFIQFSPGD